MTIIIDWRMVWEILAALFLIVVWGGICFVIGYLQSDARPKR